MSRGGLRRRTKSSSKLNHKAVKWTKIIEFSKPFQHSNIHIRQQTSSNFCQFKKVPEASKLGTKNSCFWRTLKDFRFTIHTTKLKFWLASKSRFTNCEKGLQQDLCFLYSSNNKRWQWFSINIHWIVKCVNQVFCTSNLQKNKQSFQIW